jgi:hypothetical protein
MNYIMEELKYFEDLINNYQINEVTMNSILDIKKLSDSLNDYEKQFLWKNFESKFNSIIQKFIELDIIVDSDIKDLREYPKNIINILKNTIYEMIKIEKNQDKLNELNKLYTILLREHIEEEDKQEEFEDEIEYLYEILDEKFKWLDDNENFIQLSELLEKISNEICEGVLRYVDQKKQFYTEYLKGYDTLYVKNYVRSFLLHNFNNIFNEACLDVLDQNNIKDEHQIKTIISLYYDYTKSYTKTLLLN